MASVTKKMKNCPHCGTTHVVSLDETAKTFECPRTDKTWAVAAGLFNAAPTKPKRDNYDMSTYAGRQQHRADYIAFKGA